MRREITDFERKLYQSVQGDIHNIAEIERQRQECKEYEAYIALQCELTERAREGADDCVTA